MIWSECLWSLSKKNYTLSFFNPTTHPKFASHNKCIYITAISLPTSNLPSSSTPIFPHYNSLPLYTLPLAFCASILVQHQYSTMPIKDRTVSHRAWNILRLALLWARKGELEIKEESNLEKIIKTKIAWNFKMRKRKFALGIHEGVLKLIFIVHWWQGRYCIRPMHSNIKNNFDPSFKSVSSSAEYIILQKILNGVSIQKQSTSTNTNCISWRYLVPSTEFKIQSLLGFQ